MARRKRPTSTKKQTAAAIVKLYNKGATHKYGSAGYAKDFAQKGSVGGRAGKPQPVFRPPAGSYDVTLDAQERAAQRGYDNTVDDTRLQRARSSDDFTIASGENQRQYGESLADLLKARTQSQQDYGTNLQTIARNFSQLGNVQAQRGRQAGLAGGFAAQAQRKRATNEAITRAPVDLGFQRFIEGSKLAESRLGLARDRGQGQLGLSYDRGSEDLETNLARAGVENQQFGVDIAAARQQQYAQGPMFKVPGKPKPRPGGLSRQLEDAAITRARKYAKRRRI
jgi:hypothetical protein